MKRIFATVICSCAALLLSGPAFPQAASMLLSVQSASSGLPATSAMVAYWELNEASGNATDATGNGLTGTDVNTVTSTTGLVGDCRSFASGNDESFQITDTTALEFGGSSSFAITLWVNMDSTGGDQVFVSKWNTSSNREYMLRFENGNDVPQFYVSSDGSSNTSIENTSATSMTAGGGWYFVYAYFDNSANEIGVSTNDGTVDTTTFSNNLFTGTADFFIGSADYASPPDLDGQLDEVTIWNRVLTSDEVTEIYNSGSGRAYSAY